MLYYLVSFEEVLNENDLRYLAPKMSFKNSWGGRVMGIVTLPSVHITIAEIEAGRCGRFLQQAGQLHNGWLSRLAAMTLQYRLY